MMRLISLLTLTICAALSFTTTQSAQAQNLPLVQNFYYDVSTIRPENGEPGDFIFRLTSPGAMTGCYKTTEAEIEFVDAGAVMFVKIEEGSIELNTATNYDQFGCEMKAGSSFIDIPFNKDKLHENGTYKISIKSKKVGNLFDIEVETDDNSITLNSELKTGARGQGVVTEKEIIHWFYPENTIMVSSNDMEKDPEIKKQLETIAKSKGLTSLNVELDGFKSPKGHLFYVDTKNVMDETLNDIDTIVIGQVTTSEEYQGANGPYQKRQQHAVFARRPNTHD